MNRLLTWLSVFVLATTWACSNTEKGATDPGAATQTEQAKPDDLARLLGQIPAETPYVFVSTEPMPEKIVNKIFKLIEPLRAEMEKELAEELKSMAASDALEDRAGRAILEEFAGKLSRKGLASLGIDTSPQWAIYGVGLMPVFRISLADAAKLRAAIERVEKKAGAKAPTKKIGAQDYWFFSEDGVTVAMAIVGEEFVVAVSPDSLVAKSLPIAFGQTAPAKSLASAGTIDALRKAHGYKAVGVGLISLTGITDVVLGKTGGLSAETITAMGGSLPPMTPVCKTEIGAMVAKAPQLSFGYTEISDTKWVSKANLALDPALSKELMGIVGSVAGLGDPTPAFLKVGVGLDLKKTVAFVRARLAAMAASPFKCAMLNDLNQAVTEGNANIGSVAAQLPPFLMGVKGANLVIKEADIASQDMSKVKAHVVLTADQPVQLVTMLKATVPPFANLDITPNGKPVKLPLPPGQLPPGVDPYIAMGKTGLGVSVGAGEEHKLVKLIDAKASSTTFLAVGYDIGRFMTAANQQMAAMRAMMPPEAQAANQASEAFTKAISEVFGFTYSRVDFTDHGIEFTQSVWLK